MSKKKNKKNNDPFDENQTISELNSEIIKQLSGSKLSPDVTLLDLSDPRFQLRSLDGLKESEFINLDKLTEINCSRNLLKGIDVLTHFKRLTKINASFNQIMTLELKLNNLEELDLSHNKLQKIPNLQQLPNLKELFLQDNLINTIERQVLDPVKQVLTLLDLSQNNIVFSSGIELKQFLNTLSQMNALKVLNIDKNPFNDSFPRYRDFFIRELCPPLEKLNMQIIAISIIKELKNEVNFPKLEDITLLGQQGGINISHEKDRKQMSLEQLNDIIEQCSSNPIKCLENVTQLSMEINKLLANEASWDSIFLSNDPNQQLELNDQIDNFLGFSLVLIESQQSVQKTLINIIANMSIIPQADFGTKCLGIINDLMTSGAEMRETVKNVLRDIVVPFLNKESINEVPDSVLNGLIKITLENDAAQIFTEQTIKYMSRWIKEILLYVRNSGNNYDQDLLNLHDRALELVAATSKDKSNSLEMRTYKINFDVADLFKLTTTTDYNSRYISLLEIIENTSRSDKKTGIEYLKTKELKDSLFKEIQEQMKLFFKDFKKNKNDLRDEQAKDTDQIVKIKFKKFSSLIAAYGAMLQYYQFTLSELKNDIITKELISYANLFKVNPVLLTSICNYIYDILNNQKVQKDPQMVKWIVFEMQKLNPLLPYLGGKKYGPICEIGEMYQANTFYGKEPVSRNNLTNKIIHKLFIAIIKLITYFSENANIQTPIQDVCIEISKSLNQNSREQALFKCLVIPADDVRLQIVKCLLSIRAEEWEQEEIGHLVNMIGSYKNLGAGKTEEVLSSIFMIISKLCYDQTKPAAKDFISMFGENAITDCLDILARNMERNLKDNDEENDEKIDLSCSCIHFLKTVSQIPALTNFLRGSNVLSALQRSLLAEEQFLKESFIPIEIERTWAGKNIEYLLQCASGNDTVDAYHLVSYRIISRIADVLQGKKDEKILDLGSKGYDPHFLKETLESNFKIRIKNEFNIWEEDVGIQKQNMSLSDLDHFKKQHSLFSNQQGIDRLLMFLLGKTTSSKAAMLEKKLLKEFDEKYTKIFLKEEIQKKIQIFDKEEYERQQQQEESKKKIKQTKQKRSISISNGKEILEMAFQQQSIIANFDEKMIDKYMLQPPNFIKKKEHNKSKQNQEEKTQDSDLKLLQNNEFDEGNRQIMLNKRALLVSSLLRCMQASIEYAPDREVKKHAIDQIRQKATVKMLSQLCASTGWILGNIGSKYLRIVYFGLKMSEKINSEEPDNLDIYEIVSKAIIDMLQIIRKRIMEEDKNSLTLEDKTLIYYLSRSAAIICEQIPHIHWSNTELKVINHKDATILQSPQEKCVQYLLGKLLPKNYIKTFIDVIMSEIKFSSILGKEPVKDQRDINIREKTRESIILILGNYLSKCRDNRYEILEYLIKAEIFEKKTIRQSFVQEILDEMAKSNYMNSLEKYMFDQKMLHSPDVQERILEMSICQFRDQSSSWDFRIFVMSNRSCYILIPVYNLCSICPPNQFCPEGPKLEYKLEFEKIKFLMNMEGYQRIAIMGNSEYQFSQGLFSKKTDTFIFQIFFPKVNSKNKVWKIFEKYEQIKQIEDEITIKAIQRISPDYLICIWGILNPSSDLLLEYDPQDSALIEKKRLFIIKNENLIILKENYKDWFFYNDQKKEEDKQEQFDEQSQNLDNKINKTKIEQENRAKEVQLQIYDELGQFELQNLKWVSFEKSSIPAISLKFSNQKLVILFFCDMGREKFRMALLQTLSTEAFSQLSEEPQK